MKRYFSSKRILDYCCILLSLPFCLPVVLLVALWVEITSPGPLIYCQERVGYQGNHFTIFKFRTMRCDAHTHVHEQHYHKLVQGNGPMTKLDSIGDPRLILGGHILRSLGLDELPQLANVLYGDMSLVGPRPCTIKEYGCFESSQKERFNAKPGLTGWWQVNGKNKTTFSEMVQMDIFYTRNQSLTFDLLIMLKTLPALLGHFRLFP